MNLDDFDFGFSTHSEEELIPQDNRAQQMFDAIVPLLNNLAKDADTNAYIHWPNRTKKIEEFKNKLQAILNNT